jgi:hypothetical protein
MIYKEYEGVILHYLLKQGWVPEVRIPVVHSGDKSVDHQKRFSLPQPSMDPAKIRDLATCRWVANGDDGVLLCQLFVVASGSVFNDV